MIKESAKREILYELSQAREYLLEDKADVSDEDNKANSQVSNVYANLLRRWSEL